MGKIHEIGRKGEVVPMTVDLEKLKNVKKEDLAEIVGFLLSEVFNQHTLVINRTQDVKMRQAIKDKMVYMDTLFAKLGARELTEEEKSKQQGGEKENEKQ